MNMLTNVIWYPRPAQRWVESMPIGSGRLGAMLYGGVSEDKISLNEETLWAGSKDEDLNNPAAGASLEELRQRIFNGETKAAEKLVRENFISIPKKFGSYQPFADVVIQENDIIYPGETVNLRCCDYSDYRRTLELNKGLATVAFTQNGVRYRREYLASNADNVIAIRYSNDGNIPMDFALELSQGTENCGVFLDEDTLYYESQFGEHGVGFCGAVKVVADGGSVKTNKMACMYGNAEPALEIIKAPAFTVYIAISSDFRGKDRRVCFAQLDRAAQKGYEAIKKDHICDFSSLYERFSLELGDWTNESMSMAQWLDKVRRGECLTEFTELYMNYTRYMLISASRQGGLPSNLQGKWNPKVHAMCESDYHTNINMQINYWTAQAWGLGECEDPVIDWLEDLVPYGEIAVRKNYNAKGWTVHHCSNIFGYAAPNFDVVGLWPMGGPWMCRHLYEIWQYGRDYDQMRKRLYPIIRGCVEFILDFLVEAPKDSACPGCLVTNPSVSPENEFILPDKSTGMLTYGCAMDIEIITDLFDACLDLIREIQTKEPDFDKDFAGKIENSKNRLPKIKVSPKHGGIQEWIEDYDEVDVGHRHVSQLYGVYPGRSISRKATPELADAAIRTIECKYEAGFDGQGWSLGWIANIWARLGMAENAHDAICQTYRLHILPNLMINAHGFPQVSDATGTPAAVLEMLVQSHENEIVLLPALPTAWESGKVRGLHLRGNQTLDMEWNDGCLKHATIYRTNKSIEMPVRVACGGDYNICTMDGRIEIEHV